ncbi:UNKNOWN [Stylonychia lemnae]|uniref:Uncharacterized protein n=1 Tax=Stylonychia lemnae TaxID=5949 RepID=A0A078ADR0_STYLE|nr:UNKNOWN [Stylonychia lemnae]|eukprot:CDW79971.1 UNKNOWN [Stylonychia lemnae]
MDPLVASLKNQVITNLYGTSSNLKVEQLQEQIDNFDGLLDMVQNRDEFSLNSINNKTAYAVMNGSQFEDSLIENNSKNQLSNKFKKKKDYNQKNLKTITSNNDQNRDDEDQGLTSEHYIPGKKLPQIVVKNQSLKNDTSGDIRSYKSTRPNNQVKFSQILEDDVADKQAKYTENIPDQSQDQITDNAKYSYYINDQEETPFSKYVKSMSSQSQNTYIAPFSMKGRSKDKEDQQILDDSSSNSKDKLEEQLNSGVDKSLSQAIDQNDNNQEDPYLYYIEEDNDKSLCMEDQLIEQKISSTFDNAIDQDEQEEEILQPSSMMESPDQKIQYTTLDNQQEELKVEDSPDKVNKQQQSPNDIDQSQLVENSNAEQVLQKTQDQRVSVFGNYEQQVENQIEYQQLPEVNDDIENCFNQQEEFDEQLQVNKQESQVKFEKQASFGAILDEQQINDQENENLALNQKIAAEYIKQLFQSAKEKFDAQFKVQKIQTVKIKQKRVQKSGTLLLEGASQQAPTNDMQDQQIVVMEESKQEFHDQSQEIQMNESQSYQQIEQVLQKQESTRQVQQTTQEEAQINDVSNQASHKGAIELNNDDKIEQEEEKGQDQFLLEDDLQQTQVADQNQEQFQSQIHIQDQFCQQESQQEDIDGDKQNFIQDDPSNDEQVSKIYMKEIIEQNVAIRNIDLNDSKQSQTEHFDQYVTVQDIKQLTQMSSVEIEGQEVHTFVQQENNQMNSLPNMEYLDNAPEIDFNPQQSQQNQTDRNSYQQIITSQNQHQDMSHQQESNVNMNQEEEVGAVFNTQSPRSQVSQENLIQNEEQFEPLSLQEANPYHSQNSQIENSI